MSAGNNNAGRREQKDRRAEESRKGRRAGGQKRAGRQLQSKLIQIEVILDNHFFKPFLSLVLCLPQKSYKISTYNFMI